MVEREREAPLSLPQIARTRINAPMFPQRSRSQFLLAFSFAAMLLFAQWLVAQHGASVEQHASSHACEWCLSHAPLTGALAPSLIGLVLAPALAPQPALRLVFFAGELLPAYATRAPPQSSTV